MINKKGFTLIELLAVIVILGIIMLIAIPSVSKYIDNSKKDTYIKTISNMVDVVRYGVVTETSHYNMDGKTNKTFLLSSVSLEKGSKSTPYGKLIDNKSFVVVTKKGNSYEYKVQVADEGGYGIALVNVDDLNKSMIKKVEDLEILEIGKSEYIKDGLKVHFEGANNTENGYNNKATSWYDLSGNGNNGTINGGLTTNGFIWEEDCLYNKNTNLNNNYNVNIAFNVNDSERSYQLVVSNVANSLATILSDTPNSINSLGLFIYNNFVEIRNKTVGAARINYDFFNLHSKTVITVTLSNDKLSLYINGSLISSIDNTEGLKGSTIRIFGGKVPSQISKSMKIYSFLAYNRVLTAEEVTRNYNISLIN